jgi:peroxiredoxin
MVEIGALAPEIDLPNTASQRVCLSQYRGKPVLVSFLSHAA